MSAEFDYDLTSHQWEALKALRTGAPAALLNRSVEDLIALSLATMSGNRPIITSVGRKVLVRGSPRLWDVAA
jgi:transposase